MTRKTVRWVVGAAAGLIVSTGLAAGTAQAASPNLPGSLLDATGAGPVGAVCGILPAGQ
jgi:hypothetical protein